MTPAVDSSAVPLPVLVIEDHPLVRQSLVFNIGRAGGGPVVETTTAAEARAAAASQSFSMATLDLRLADASGLDLVPELKELGVARILVLSASDDHFTVRAAFTAGVDGYLLKSSSPDVVVAGIRAVLDGEVFTDPAVASLLVRSLRQPSALLEELTRREKELLLLVAEGLTNKDIGTHLFMSPATVKSHLARIGRKLGAHDRSEMVATAMRAGVLV
jgi:DNA-binding NarL/FixJ family response regulator